MGLRGSGAGTLGAKNDSHQRLLDGPPAKEGSADDRSLCWGWGDTLWTNKREKAVSAEATGARAPVSLRGQAALPSVWSPFQDNTAAGSYPGTVRRAWCWGPPGPQPHLP